MIRISRPYNEVPEIVSSCPTFTADLKIGYLAVGDRPQLKYVFRLISSSNVPPFLESS